MNTNSISKFEKPIDIQQAKKTQHLCELNDSMVPQSLKTPRQNGNNNWIDRENSAVILTDVGTGNERTSSILSRLGQIPFEDITHPKSQLNWQIYILRASILGWPHAND